MKFLKKEFYTKETKKKGVENCVANLSAICGNFSERVSGKQSSLNLSIVMFQFSFNFESSLKFFSVEFSVEFSFSCLTW